MGHLGKATFFVCIDIEALECLGLCTPSAIFGKAKRWGRSPELGRHQSHIIVTEFKYTPTGGAYNHLQSRVVCGLCEPKLFPLPPTLHSRINLAAFNGPHKFASDARSLHQAPNG